MLRYDAQLKHGHLLLGKDKENGQELRIPANRGVVLVCGASGSGKSTAMTGIVERMGAAGYQFLLVDPEGDYDNLPQVITHGTEEQAPDPDHLLKTLETSLDHGIAANLLGLPLEDRPHFYPRIMHALMELRHRTGRPHWLVFDEAHHILPADGSLGNTVRDGTRSGVVLVTVHPNWVNRAILEKVDLVLALGKAATHGIGEFCRAVGSDAPQMGSAELRAGEALVWSKDEPQRVQHIVMEPGKTERRRHIRKYASGELPEERSFYFVGPEKKLNLRAQNLMMFSQIAEGVDDETWLHHLNHHDYSRWIREEIKDQELAGAVAEAERKGSDPKQSRSDIKKLISEKYTL